MKAQRRWYKELLTSINLLISYTNVINLRITKRVVNNKLLGSSSFGCFSSRNVDNADQRMLRRWQVSELIKLPNGL